MKTELHPWHIIGLGFILALAGVIFPWLMVLRVIEPTFTVSFFSFGASMAGLFLGIIGAAWYVRLNKK